MAGENKRRKIGARLVLGVAVAASLLLGTNALVERLEQRGVVETRTHDDWVRLPGAQEMFVSNGEEVAFQAPMMVSRRFPIDKGGSWRAFVLGGSFAMGTPGVRQTQQGWLEQSGIAHTLQQSLQGSQPVEVINAATGGMNSWGVGRVLRSVLPYEPDLIIIATCNNEGTLPPSALAEALDGFGGYRLLRRAVRRDVPPAERSYFTPQHPELDKVRAQYKRNLEVMVFNAKKKGIPVVLATLPVNLRFAGEDPGIHTLQVPGGPPPSAEDAACVQQARAQLATDPEAAIAHLDRCPDLPEALRLRGLALVALDQPDAARPLLEQALALMPMNRCRPAFQDIIRTVAEENEHVHLADLQQEMEKRAEGGLPGDRYFVDSCHLDEEGYRIMGEAIAQTISAAGLGPAP